MARTIYKIVSFAGTVVFAFEAFTFVVQSGPVRMFGTEIDPRVMLTAYRLLAVFCGTSFLSLNYKAVAALLGRRPTVRFRALADDLAYILKMEYEPPVRLDRAAGVIEYAARCRTTVRSLEALGVTCPNEEPLSSQWQEFVEDMWELAQDGDLKGARRYPLDLRVVAEAAAAPGRHP